MSELTSPLLSKVAGIRHSFGTIAHPTPVGWIGDWPSLKASWKQVHGTSNIELTRTGETGLEADAFYTFTPGVPVSATHADCVPVLLSRLDGRAVAAVHAGWRGTRARILQKLWATLAARGEKEADWVASVGPSIGPCCYEVSPELAADFSTEFASLGSPGARRSGLAVPRERHLDLPSINAAQLEEVGLREVEVLRACTKCAVHPHGPNAGQPIFHSYRREGKAWPQYSTILMPG
jgi:YfiH family protein